MGKLILESYTNGGKVWLGKKVFFSLCNTIKEVVHEAPLDNFVIILTDLERKETFLEGAELCYGLSYVFKQKIADAKELETKVGLTKEKKIIVLDDMVNVHEGLARDDGSKIQHLFRELIARHRHPYPIGLDLHYYVAKGTKQFVLPIDEQKDVVYLVGENILFNQTHIN